MRSRPHRSIRAAAALLAATFAMGCAGLSTLQSATAPTDLYVLSPKTSHDTDLPATTTRPLSPPRMTPA
jgi:hypothetical protein